MAKIRRKQNRIAAGLKKGFQRALNFGSNRRNEVAESLNSELKEEQDMSEDFFEDLLKRDLEANYSTPVPSVHPEETQFDFQAPEPSRQAIPDQDVLEANVDGMRVFAQSIHKLGRDQEVRTMYLLLINNYTKLIQEHPIDFDIDKAKAKLEEKQEQLASFDKEIEIIELEEKIEKEVEAMNRSLPELASLYEKIIQELEKENYHEAFNLAETLNSKIRGNMYTPSGYEVGSYEFHDHALYNLEGRYCSVAGVEYEYHNRQYMKPEYVTNIYREIATYVAKIEATAETLDESENELYVQYRSLCETLKSVIQLLPFFLKEPRSVQEELDKIYTEVQTKKNEPVKLDDAYLEAVRIGYEVTLSKKMTEIKNKLRDLSVDFKAYDAELKQLLAELDSLIRNEKELSSEVKDEIINKLENKCNEELHAEFGDVYEFLHDYAEDLQNMLEKIANMTYDHPSFEETHHTLMQLISSMKIDGAKLGVQVRFDEQTQMLEMDFPVSVMHHYENQVVSDEVLRAMQVVTPQPSAGETGSFGEDEKERQKQNFKNEVSFLSLKYGRLIEKQLEDLKDYSFNSLDEKLQDLFNDTRFSLLSDEEKNAIIGEVSNLFNQELENKYGADFLEFIFQTLFVKLGEMGIRELRTMSLSDETLRETYGQVMYAIQNFENDIKIDAKLSKYIKKFEFDGEKQTLVIHYNNEALKSSQVQIVSDEVLENFQKFYKGGDLGASFDAAATAPVPGSIPASGSAPVPGSSPTPVSPSHTGSEHEPIQDEEKEFVDAYLAKLEEINNLVVLLNEINANLESQAITNFVNPADAKRTVEIEQEAKSLDQRLMSLKVELSKDRLDFKKKFNKYILSLPEVKEVEIKEVQFSGSLNDFIAQHDEMIVEAENKIFELDNLRTSQPENLAEIQADIQSLLDFIEAQNSLVGRRLVSEAKNRDLDIVSLLQERRENKKEIRERLRQVKENTTVVADGPEVGGAGASAPIPEPVPEPKPEPKPQPEPEAPVLSEEELSRREAQERTQVFAKLQELLEAELRRQVAEERTSFNGKLFRQNFLPETQAYITELENHYAPAMIAMLIDRYEVDYNNALMREKSGLISELFDSIRRIQFAITREDVVSEEFETNLSETLKDLVEYYKEIYDLSIEYNYAENILAVKYTADRVDFDNSRVIKEPVSRYVSDFLAPNVYQAYMDNKKKDVVLTNQLLQTVGEYFINGYSNGKVVFQSVAKNALVKESGFSVEEIEMAILQLMQMGVIENRRGLLGAICTREEFLSKLVPIEEQDLAKQDAPVPEPDTKQEEPKVNIVQRGLTFNPKENKQFTSKAYDIITTGDAVTVSLIKNGIKIKYSQDLREKLSQLNAKLSLVNKDNYRSRTSVPVNDEMEEQTVEFKDDREVCPEDYKIEIRVPNAGDSDVLYEFDLDQVSDELKARSK